MKVAVYRATRQALAGKSNRLEVLVRWTGRYLCDGTFIRIFMDIYTDLGNVKQVFGCKVKCIINRQWSQVCWPDTLTG